MSCLSLFVSLIAGRDRYSTRDPIVTGPRAGYSGCLAVRRTGSRNSQPALVHASYISFPHRIFFATLLASRWRRKARHGAACLPVRWLGACTAAFSLNALILACRSTPGRGLCAFRLRRASDGLLSICLRDRSAAACRSGVSCHQRKHTGVRDSGTPKVLAMVSGRPSRPRVNRRSAD